MTLILLPTIMPPAQVRAQIYSLSIPWANAQGYHISPAQVRVQMFGVREPAEFERPVQGRQLVARDSVFALTGYAEARERPVRASRLGVVSAKTEESKR